MDLRFNIIFVPGTARYLRLGVASLLAHSPYRYRLVANGLDETESGLLERFCRTSPRLEYYCYGNRRMLNRGTMLNLLLQRENSPWFCFADSDVFADASFHENLEKALKNAEIFSFGLPLFMDPESRLEDLSGRCLATPSGRHLTPIYFSVYRHDPVQAVPRGIAGVRMK